MAIIIIIVAVYLIWKTWNNKIVRWTVKCVLCAVLGKFYYYVSGAFRLTSRVTAHLLKIIIQNKCRKWKTSNSEDRLSCVAPSDVPANHRYRLSVFTSERFTFSIRPMVIVRREVLCGRYSTNESETIFISNPAATINWEDSNCGINYLRAMIIAVWLHVKN